MSVHFKKFPPALKHAGYSATTLLPGENRAAFEKLHRALVAELVPVGPLEEDIVADLARLIWRKQNLATCRMAELAQARRLQPNFEGKLSSLEGQIDKLTQQTTRLRGELSQVSYVQRELEREQQQNHQQLKVRAPARRGH